MHKTLEEYYGNIQSNELSIMNTSTDKVIKVILMKKPAFRIERDENLLKTNNGQSSHNTTNVLNLPCEELPDLKIKEGKCVLKLAQCLSIPKKKFLKTTQGNYLSKQRKHFYACKKNIRPNIKLLDCLHISSTSNRRNINRNLNNEVCRTAIGDRPRTPLKSYIHETFEAFKRTRMKLKFKKNTPITNRENEKQLIITGSKSNRNYKGNLNDKSVNFKQIYHAIRKKCIFPEFRLDNIKGIGINNTSFTHGNRKKKILVLE